MKMCSSATCRLEREARGSTHTMRVPWRLAHFTDQVRHRDQFRLEIDIEVGEFEGDATGLPFQQIQGFVVVQEAAELGQEVRGEVTFSAQPVHQGAVVGSQLLGQEAGVVFCLGFHHPADDGGEVVFRHV